MGRDCVVGIRDSFQMGRIFSSRRQILEANVVATLSFVDFDSTGVI
jgi:hypothetical protein